MLMPPYPVYCQGPGCGRLGVYKVAARWSDGFTEELKTYSLCCEQCLAGFFRESQERHAACHRVPGEILEPPGIYALMRGQRDRQLERRSDLESA